MFGLGWMEIGVILIVALLLFGPRRLPEIGRSLGLGFREFKKAGHELTEALTKEDSDGQNHPKEKTALELEKSKDEK